MSDKGHKKRRKFDFLRSSLYKKQHPFLKETLGENTNYRNISYHEFSKQALLLPLGSNLFVFLSADSCLAALIVIVRKETEEEDTEECTFVNRVSLTLPCCPIKALRALAPR